MVEHPLVSALYDIVVREGDWTRAEELLQELSDASLYDNYLRSCRPYASWTRLTGTNADGDVPSARSGHAMCIDYHNEHIYLFGGYDGKKSLDDFWEYDIKARRWKVLSYHTTPERNAPGARSCHKMIFDHKTGSIYVLGKMHDDDAMKAAGESLGRSNETVEPEDEGMCSEFYRYHTRGADRGKWDFLAFDTAVSSLTALSVEIYFSDDLYQTSGGPPLVYDHSMVMDSENQIVYVFGGRVVCGDIDLVRYSGLYSYNVRNSKWRHLSCVPY